MARLEVLALERGKPRGFFATPFDTWLEWKRAEAQEVRLRPTPYEYELYFSG